jgi:glycosyltransferase involved in cell wall biosynthesis
VSISIIIPTKNAHQPWLEKALGSCSFADEIIIRRDEGLAGAINRGVLYSSGDYIAILPDDDYFLWDIREVVKVVNTGEFDIVHFPCLHQVEEGIPQGLYDASPDITLEQNIIGNKVFGSSFIRRSAWEMLGGYQGDICMDWDLYNRALVSRMKFKYVPVASAVFRWNKHSLLQNKSIGQSGEIRRYIETSLAKWREHVNGCPIPNLEV